MRCGSRRRAATEAVASAAPGSCAPTAADLLRRCWPGRRFERAHAGAAQGAARGRTNSGGEATEGDQGREVAALEEPRARADDETVRGDGEGALYPRRAAGC